MLILTYLDRLLKSDCVILAEANSSPLEHLRLLSEIRNRKRLILCKQGPVLAADQIIDLIEQILAPLYPLVSF